MSDTAASVKARLRQEKVPARRLAIIEDELCPPEPQLLDTCVIQNLDWVDRQLETAGSLIWDDAKVADLSSKYGADLANDLIDLGILYKEFENRSGYPWMICNAAAGEAALLGGVRGQRIGELLRFVRGHQEDWSVEAYPGIAHGLLFLSRSARVSPLLLRGLGVLSVEEIYSERGSLSFLPDLGDRVVATHALIVNIPVILTTDRATFWKHRGLLNDVGLTIARPSELLEMYLPYWELLDAEFARRRAAKP